MSPETHSLVQRLRLQDTVVVEHQFGIPDAESESERTFDATIRVDRTCLWEEREEFESDLPWPVQLIPHDDGNFDLRVYNPVTFNSILNEKDYMDVLELDALSLNQVSDQTELWRAIDEILAPYFWSDVNPRLEVKLTRRRLGAKQSGNAGDRAMEA